LALSVVFAHNPALAIAALTLGLAGIMTTLPLFWSLPTSFLAGAGAAAGIALINSLGNLSGFVSPYAIGWLKEATGSTDTGVYLLACAMVVGTLLTLSVPKRLVNR
jgi:nitrate/nitrite transporter NarK